MEVDDILSKYSDSDKKEEESGSEEEKKEFVKRKPALWRLVKDIKKEDGRVRVIGIVTELDADSGVFSIDDGNNISIIGTPEQIKDLKLGQKVGVIGMVIPFSDNLEIRAEIVRDYDKIDMVLYKKFMEFMRDK